MLESKKYTTKVQARKDNVSSAARSAAYNYVEKGMGKLNLSYKQQQQLFKELVPVVQKRIQADRSRTAARVENIAKTQAKKKMDKARKTLG
jgi:hypothetical protein